MRASPVVLVEQAIHDARHAIRGLRRTPGFALGVILILALGIGANVAMFGIVDRLMFRPYPYLRDPGTVHRVYLRQWARGTLHTNGSYEYTIHEDLKRWTTSFSQIAAFAHQTNAVGLGEAARERRVGQVSASFFSFFDAQPVLGRWFAAAEDTVPRGADVAVLGYDFWQSEYGGRDVLGEIVHVGNIAATIVGVAPPGFAGVNDVDPPALYIPITTYAAAQASQRATPTYYTHYNWGWMNVMVRRKPGVSIAQANADATQSYRRSWEVNRIQEPELTPPVEIAKPFAEVAAMRVGAGPNPGLEARTAFWVSAVTLIVLLIACANVANLFVARALRRQRETAVRLALGVSRGRLVRQSLVEALTLSLAGSAAGLVVAHWGGAAIRRLLVSTQREPLETFTDWRMIGATIAIALVVGVATGLVPAVVSGRGDLTRSLKAGSRGAGQQRSRARTSLLILQGALSVVLLVGAGLFVKSLSHVKALRLGYDAGPVLMAFRNMRGMETDSLMRIALRRSLLEAAQAIPGVEKAAYVSSIPFWSTSSTNLFVQGIDSVRRLGQFTYQTGTPGMFDVLGTRIIRGRPFTDADREGAPLVAIVSEAMARVLWPGRDALGQCIRMERETAPCRTVVGIAENIVQQQQQLGVPDRYHYYLPIEQFRSSGGSYVVMRMRGDPRAQVEAVRSALQPRMPGQSYVTVTPLADVVDRTRSSWELGATLFVAFGGLALVVAALGLYSVIGYSVTQRMHELGVRVALGAQVPDIVRLVVGQALHFAAAGVIIGIVLSLAAARWVEPLLFQQSPRDPAVFALVAVVLLGAAVAASASPALRASRADPNTALRAE